jgi:exopolysaccharide biosynthesis protein
VRLALERRTRAGGTLGAWTVDSAAPAAALALNAGQFADARPWGWVVADGAELQPPGYGPQSMALVVDDAGGARLVPMDSIAIVRAQGGVAQAFQSYPTLLVGDGTVPLPLRAPGRGVDVEHRDARLAVGELRDGRLLVALTRFEGLGGILAELPFGPTAPEMAALMGALGARRAVLLDGGLSAQLVVRDGGETRSWRGLRRVPLGLVAVPRRQSPR